MPEISTPDSSVLRDMTTAIAAAYVSHHHLPPTDVPALITTVHGALVGLTTGAAAAPAEVAIERPTSAQIRKSITPEGLISFLDGKSYKTLKRHLRKFGLDPHGYRERFGLPADYPTVAANYSATRSTLAQQLGLGQRSADGGRSKPRAANSTKRANKKAAE